MLIFSIFIDFSNAQDLEQETFATDFFLKIDTSTNIIKRELPKTFKENYHEDDFNYEISFEETLSLYERFMRWLINLLSRLFNSTPEGTGNVISIGFKIIGISLILWVIFKIIMLLINKEGNFIFGRSSDTLIIEAKNIEKNIHSTDFKSLISKAENENNYRLAIRYHYLQVLKHLSTKGKIEWDAEKTNYDYYRELKDEKLKKEFQYISYIYDYAWYGEFELNDADYQKGISAFSKILKNK